MKRELVCLPALLLSVWALPAAHAADDFTILHTFTGPSTEAYPNFELVLVGSTIYGTSTSGGTDTFGTVFKIETNGNGYSNIQSFKPSSIGYNPTSGLMYDGTSFFGTTSKGQYTQSGGSVYRINTAGTIDILHDFYGQPTSLLNGDRRSQPTLIGSILYGTTVYGGDNGAGTIYALNTNGSGYTVLHSFESGKAFISTAAPLATNGSTLFGTTVLGGDHGAGTIYAINPDGSGYNILHSFESDYGGNPASFCGGLLLVGSSLYGTTERGGEFDAGAIFKINTDGSGFELIHSFNGSDGNSPVDRLTFSGSTLYGKTYRGGENDYGVIFQIDTNGTGYDVLHSFSLAESDGGIMGGLITDGAKLYGVSRYGGSFNCGILYSLSIPEPSTFALLIAGIFGLLAAGGWRRWRTHEKGVGTIG